MKKFIFCSKPAFAWRKSDRGVQCNLTYGDPWAILIWECFVSLHSIV